MIGTFHIVVAMKPLDGNFVENSIKHGIAGLNIDGCRVVGAKGNGVWGTSNKTINTERKFNASPEMTEYRSEQHEAGRWPANVIHDGSEKVMSGFPDAGKGNMKGVYCYAGKEYNNKDTSMFNGDKPQAPSNYNDSGSAARFFKACGEFRE